MKTEQEQPSLAGIRVLDASRVLAGPYAAMMLGDLGADVIKIERPDTGDQTRAWGPPYQKGESAYYLSINRNKRSLTLNLKTAQGQQIFRQLADRSDVLLESFRVGDLEQLKLGYEALRQQNPKLIHCSITGYGQTGPWKDRPAYDIALQAECGLMSITGPEEGEPVRIGVAVIDILTAHYAVQAVLASLWARLHTGQGQQIDVAMLDCGAALLSYMAQYFFATGKPPQRMGSKHPTIAPYQAFVTSDGYIVVAVGSQEIWTRFCTAIAHEELATDPRFVENAQRVGHREELDALLTEICKEKTTQQWLVLFEQHDVPAAPVNDLRAVLALPQLQERQMVQSVLHPTIGALKQLGMPVKFSGSGAQLRLPPPLLGQHTNEILCELGYSEDQVKRFREQGVV